MDKIDNQFKPYKSIQILNPIYILIEFYLLQYLVKNNESESTYDVLYRVVVDTHTNKK